MATTTQRIETGDAIVTVETTVTTKSKFVDYDDIRAAVRIEADEYSDAPWENCDGYEHSFNRARFEPDADERDQAGYVHGGWQRDSGVITLDNDFADDYRFYRLNGQSRQVAAERVAQLKRDALAQLVKWYSDGWESWYVCGEFDGYEGESCGGFDSYEYAEEFADEVADGIADQMEDDGYVVLDRPERKTYSNADNVRSRQKWMSRINVTTGRDLIGKAHRRHIQRKRDEAVRRAQSL